MDFFYGDCVPNLDRPVKISWRRLFRYLMNREELEYHLASDKDDPLIPGGRYIGPAQSRWNMPEFAAVFVDTVRNLQHKGLFHQARQDLRSIFTAHRESDGQRFRVVSGEPSYGCFARRHHTGADFRSEAASDAQRAKGLAAHVDAYYQCDHDAG